MSFSRRSAIATLLVLVAGCATNYKVDIKEPRRLVATESDVRLDAEIRTDTLSASQQIPIDYLITNNRSGPIAVAELIPDATYDYESRIVTVGLGSEIPGEEMLPRLVMIGPGQQKKFSAMARVTIPPQMRAASPFVARPGAIQLKLSFLSETNSFESLIGIPERVVHDPKLAAALFPKWLESNETIFTNILPMRWSTRTDDSESQPAPPPAAVPRRRP